MIGGALFGDGRGVVIAPEGVRVYAEETELN